MNLIAGRCAITVLVLMGGTARAEELTRTISHEASRFQISQAGLAVGRDGQVYTWSGDSVIGCRPDGTDRKSGTPGNGEPVSGVTALSDGRVATAIAHFRKTVAVWDSDLHTQRGADVGGYLVNDKVGWSAPGTVTAGSDGRFYALDQYRCQVVQIDRDGHRVAVISLEDLETILWGERYDLRVAIAADRIYLTSRNKLHAFDLKGRSMWNAPYGVAGLDCEEDGTLHLLGSNSRTVKRLDRDGKSLPAVELDAGLATYPTTRLAVLGDRYVLRGRDDRELFRVYSRTNGTLTRIILAQVESLSLTVTNRIWTPGARMPIAWTWRGAQGAAPDLALWIRPFGLTEFQPLPVKDGCVTVPADLPGLCQVRLGVGRGGGDDEPRLDTLVEIRPAGTRFGLSIWTPDNRVDFVNGEAIPVQARARAARPEDRPANATVELTPAAGGPAAWRQAVALATNGVGSVLIPASSTAHLAAGIWRIGATLDGAAVAPQWLRIGRGGPIPVPTAVVQYGDYGNSLPAADVYALPERIDAHIRRLTTTGVNLVVDRYGHLGMANGRALSAVADLPWLAKDPLAPAPEKGVLEDVVRRATAAYGAAGIESRGILLGMDAGIPLGNQFDTRKPESMVADLLRVSRLLAGYRSFTGWSWAANWWLQPPEKQCRDAAELAAWTQALKNANEKGVWDPVLETVGERWMSLMPEAHRFLSKPLRAEFPNLTRSITGPFRQMGVYPPLSFDDAEEVDLQFQSEQIQPPLMSAFSVDFYRRPGKRVWGHIELFNDSGTGGEILPQTLFMAMRAPDGVGWNGDPTGLQGRPFVLDPRWSAMGRSSVSAAAAAILRAYLPWWKALAADDPVALLVSRRMMTISPATTSTGSYYFERLWAAHTVLLAAGRSATVVFPEDMPPDAIKRFSAVLVVNQAVPPEPAFAKLVSAASAAGIPVYADNTCRSNVVPGAVALGVDLDALKPQWQSDINWPLTIRQVDETARQLAVTDFGRRIPAAFTSDAGGLYASQRHAGQGRYVWLVNQSRLPGDADHWWRTTLNCAETAPLNARIEVPNRTGVVYDVFAHHRLAADAALTADYADLPARLYAVLPEAVRDLRLTTSRSGDQLDWTLRFAGPDTLIPVRIRLVGADGTVIAEEHRAAALAGISGSFAVAPAGSRVEAVELLGGERAGADQATAAAPAETIGQRVGDIVVSRDGRTLLVACRRVGNNVLALDAATGANRWQGQVGEHIATAPTAAEDGFTVMGVDLSHAEVNYRWLLDVAGRSQTRIAGFGIPQQACNWAFPTYFENRPARIVSPASGAWSVTGGDLGLACLDDRGRARWQRLPKSGQPPAIPWAVSPRGVLVTEQDMLAFLAHDDGHALWTVTPLPGVPLSAAALGADGKVAVTWTVESGGSLAVVRGADRNGVLAETWPIAIERLDLAPDGALAAIANGPRLTLLDLARGPRWGRTFGEANLLRPCWSPDGRRVACGDELGGLYVIDGGGRDVACTNLGSAPATAWLPGGDLAWATWLGEAGRMAADGTLRWRQRLTPGSVQPLVATATHRVESGNALAQPLPLTPNLIDTKNWMISARFEPRANGPSWLNPIDILADGDGAAPAKPWLDIVTIGNVESGWVNQLTLGFDAWRRRIRLDAVTIVEDPAHPDSWLRNARLQWWDDENQRWADGPVLRSDQAVHSHRMPTPLESRAFRLIGPGGCGRWPAAAPRFGELVFHGVDLGSSHRDVAAGRPLAVLFDERDTDHPGIGEVVAFDKPYSGTRYLHFATPGKCGPPFLRPVGHTLANWDFPIVEKPGPGEYRWAQFAWRKADSATTAIALRLNGDAFGKHALLFAGAASTLTEGAVSVKVADAPPKEWTVVRVDLWNTLAVKNRQADIRLRGMSVESVGGGVDIDQLVLGRTPADLPPERP